MIWARRWIEQNRKKEQVKCTVEASGEQIYDGDGQSATGSLGSWLQEQVNGYPQLEYDV